MESVVDPIEVSQQHHEPKRCSFLGLPPELRNRIYDFAFILPDTQERPHSQNQFPSDMPLRDLLAKDELPQALLLTCRTICWETLVMYRLAHELFWGCSVFSPFEMTSGKALEKLQLLPASDVRRMKHIEQANGFYRSGALETFSYSAGVWTTEHEDPSGEDQGHWLILPTDGLPATLEALLEDAGAAVVKIAPHGQKSWRAFVHFEPRGRCCEPWESYLQSRDLSLWELEGVMRHFVPRSLEWG